MTLSLHHQTSVLSPREEALKAALPPALPSLQALPSRSALLSRGRAPNLTRFKSGAREAWEASPESLLEWLKAMQAGITPRQPGSPKRVGPLSAGLDFAVRFDGCSEGNPGRMGLGIALFRAGEVQGTICQYQVPVTDAHRGWLYGSNNVAELLAMLYALLVCRDILRHDPSLRLVVEGDNGNVFEWVQGNFQVKEPRLAPFIAHAQLLLAEVRALGPVQLHRIDREFNDICDILSKLAAEVSRRDGTAAPSRA